MEFLDIIPENRVRLAIEAHGNHGDTAFLSSLCEKDGELAAAGYQSNAGTKV
jgi:hypothetical protein